MEEAVNVVASYVFICACVRFVFRSFRRRVRFNVTVRWGVCPVSLMVVNFYPACEVVSSNPFQDSAPDTVFAVCVPRERDYRDKNV